MKLRRLEDVAKRLGFEYQEIPGFLGILAEDAIGTYRERPVSIKILPIALISYLLILVDFPSQKCIITVGLSRRVTGHMTLQKRKSSSLGPLSLDGSTQTGDKKFDKFVRLDSKLSEFAEAIFAVDELRSKLLQLNFIHPLTIDEGTVLYNTFTDDPAMNPDNLARFIDLMCDIADEAEGAEE